MVIVVHDLPLEETVTVVLLETETAVAPMVIVVHDLPLVVIVILLKGLKEESGNSSPKPYGFDKVLKKHGTRGQEENNDSFFWLEDHKDDK